MAHHWLLLSPLVCLRNALHNLSVSSTSAWLQPGSKSALLGAGFRVEAGAVYGERVGGLEKPQPRVCVCSLFFKTAACVCVWGPRIMAELLMVAGRPAHGQRQHCVRVHTEWCFVCQEGCALVHYSSLGTLGCLCLFEADSGNRSIKTHPRSIVPQRHREHFPYTE